MLRKLLPFVKVLVALAILGWLYVKNREAIDSLWDRDKNLTYLAASLLSMFVAVCLSFVRWFLLVRALEIRFTLREAFRYGFIGYLFNFVGPSAVGGDLVKAILLAREQTNRRAEAVATIFLDRVVGFYSLLIVATTTILLSDATQLQELGRMLQLVVWTTLAVTIGFVILMLPSSYTRLFTGWLCKLPFLGGIAYRVLAALGLYRQRRGTLLLILTVSMFSHFCIAMTVRYADLALYEQTPRFMEHMIISPLASVAAAAPLPGGIGPFEFTMDYLFVHLPKLTMKQGQGLSVAVIYRLVTVCVAMIGVVYYFANRSTVQEVTAAEGSDSVALGR